jgi:hypothetical protein
MNATDATCGRAKTRRLNQTALPVAVRRTRHVEYPTDSNWFADGGRG